MIIGDREGREDFESRVRQESFDAVIDMICFNEADARSTVAAFKDCADQIVVCSSVAVYKRPYRSVLTVESAESLYDDPIFGYAYDNTPAERLGYCPRDNSEDFVEEIFEAQHRAREQSQAASKSSATDVADQAAVVSGIKAVHANEPPAEGLFQGGPFCAMEFTGDLAKID